MRKPILYVLVGLPASGKTTFTEDFCRRYDGVVGISRDDIRFSVLKEGEDYFSHEYEVFSKFTDIITQLLSDHFDVIADATHLNEKSRNKLLSAIDTVDYDIIYVYFNTPVTECCYRNSLREGRRKVPEEVIMDMNRALTIPTMKENRRCIGVIEWKGITE